MTFLLEDPWPVILFVVLIETGLAVALWRTGRGVLLLAMLAVLLLGGGLVALEWVVVTERERVEQAVYDGAATLETNDPQRVLAFLTTRNAITEQLVRRAMREVEFTRVKVTHVEVDEINRLASPPMAVARVFGIVEFELRQGHSPYSSRPIDVTLTFRLINGRWLVESHDWRKDQPPGMP